MELAGSLAREGTHARLRLESLSPLENAVVACGSRRFLLVLSQDMVNELCQKPGCNWPPISPIIVRCSEHLADCDVESLEEMAVEWGYARHDELDQDPARLGVAPEADALIRAAVAHGAFELVSTSLLHACFEDPEMIDEVFMGEDRAVDMRYGLDRERIRLRRIAEKEARRLREEASSCSACGGDLHGTPPILRVPPQYCSKDCAPAPSPSGQDLVPPW